MRSKRLNNALTRKPPYLLGAHLSIAKGLHQALYEAQAYRCAALQVFTKNAGTWKERILSREEVDLFDQAREKTGINTLASHAAYLINLAAPDKRKHAMSCDALKHELVRSSALRIPYVVLHPGFHMGAGEKEGIRRIAEGIHDIFGKTPDSCTRLLLETTAGQGSGVGHRFEQLAAILDMLDQRLYIGVCLDTCHVFAAGYDIRTKTAYRKTMDAFHSIIGLERLFLVHLNDSKKELGSRVDRHEHIGRGAIGEKAFEFFMNDPRFFSIPKIIETPKGKKAKDWDRVNLERLRRLCRP